MSTANWPPPWFDYLPDFMPKEKVLGLLEEISANAEDIRVVAEKAMSSAEKAMSAMAELIASNDKEIITYVRELSQYRLVYEWRGILDWCVRVIFSSSPKSSSGLLWKNFATQNSSVIDKVFTSVQPHFPVSFQVVDRIRKRFVDVYDAANGVMHRSPAIDEEKGLCCGGINLENMLTAAASVLSLQQLCIQRSIPIPPELNFVAVLNPSFDSVHGDCIKGVYVPRPGPAGAAASAADPAT
ncbi:hypothetical protein T492DRAFT_1089610 [Pavlovales sp. CCMP2436]|nr:hypothetical protein T492DRAFT_1089610 [Pavlovales sp. CCMP2436]